MSHDESELFRQSMRGVRPLSPAPAPVIAPVPPPPPAPAAPPATLAQLARRAAAQAEMGMDRRGLATQWVEPLKPWDEICFQRPGVQEGVFRKLRLGQYPIEGRLDLHHMSVEQARRELLSFIDESLRHEVRTVLILHGKGEKNPGQHAILKSHLAVWLPELPGVMAAHSAQRHHGGTGAVYVLLRKSERQRLDNRERYARRAR